MCAGTGTALAAARGSRSDLSFFARAYCGWGSPQQTETWAVHLAPTSHRSHSPAARPAFRFSQDWSKASGSCPVASTCFAPGCYWEQVWGICRPHCSPSPNSRGNLTAHPLVLSGDIPCTNFLCLWCLAGSMIYPSLMWGIKPFVQIWLRPFGQDRCFVRRKVTK